MPPPAGRTVAARAAVAALGATAVAALGATAAVLGAAVEDGAGWRQKIRVRSTVENCRVCKGLFRDPD